MHIVFALCVGLMSGKTISGAYYGPYYPGVPDTVQIRLMQESIQSTQSLERTVAARPHIQTTTYYHHDNSTNMSVNSGRGTIKISHHANPAINSLKPGAPAQAVPPSASWWQRIKRFVYPSKSDQEPAGYFSSKRDLAYKTMFMGYAYINFRLFRLALYLQDSERWFFWKKEVPLAQLIALPPQDMAPLLVADIRGRYASDLAHVKTDNPFGAFMKALDEEVAMLNSYQTLSNILLKVDAVEHQCLTACCQYMPKIYGISLSYFVTCLASKLRVKTLFYLDDALLQAVPERLARLAYLKSVFVNWLAEHKLFVAKGMLHKGILTLRPAASIRSM